MKFKIINRYIRVINKEVPLWLKIMNGVNLLPIIAWPLVAVLSIFLLTSRNYLMGLASFFFVINYPWPLIESVNLSFNLYLKTKTILAVLVSVTVSLLLIAFLIYVIGLIDPSRALF
jgi:hypothetical protein